ncbi:MAG: oxygen-independent coproporphyrinogen III oxidase [Salinibacter sp.]
MHDLSVDLELIRRYNRPGPRYTSYPTAPHFHKGYGPAAFAEDLSAPAASTPLSLYLHLPFCRSLCYYCGCHMTVTRDRERIQAYLETLKREIDQTAAHLDPRRPVVQVHWGGGTPSYLSADQIRALGAHLHDRFPIADNAEISLEADPRTLTKERLAAAAAIGVNRLSVGVQDVNPAVQEAINRVQPTEQVAQVVRWARASTIESINVDLVYGLPHQTPARFETTLDVTERLAPDRIALYSYAHVPSIKKHQRAIDEDALPEPEAKLRLFKRGIERLTGPGGYRFIGMDHFARPHDPLAVAQDEGTLHRNFQGYSTRAEAEVVAFGASGISQLDGAYAQNAKALPAYRERVEDGRLPTDRGYRLTPEDRLRRHVIGQLMCHFHLEKAPIENRFDVDFDATFADALAALRPMEADGLVTLTPEALHVRPPGRLLIRNIAMAFDAYWQANDEQPVHAQTV